MNFTDNVYKRNTSWEAGVTRALEHVAENLGYILDFQIICIILDFVACQTKAVPDELRGLNKLGKISVFIHLFVVTHYLHCHYINTLDIYFCIASNLLSNLAA